MPDYTLTIKVPITSEHGPIDPEIAVALNRMFRSGTTPPAANMLWEGLRACLRVATHQACQKNARVAYLDHPTVQIGDKTYRAKWHLEAEVDYDAIKKSGGIPYATAQPRIQIEVKA